MSNFLLKTGKNVKNISKRPKVALVRKLKNMQTF